MNKNNSIDFHHFNVKAQNFEQTVKFYQSLDFQQIHTWNLHEFNITECRMMYHPKARMYIEICDKKANMPTQGRSRLGNDEYIEM